MVYTATISNPAFNYTGGVSGVSEAVPVAWFQMDQAFNMVSACQLRIRSAIASKYSLESTDSNPLQLNATVLVTDDAVIWWRGYVRKKPDYQNFEQGRFMVVEVLGYDGILLDTLCIGPNGEDLWTMETAKWQCVQFPLKESRIYGSFQGGTLWPDPLDVAAVEAYINDANSKSDALTTDLGISTYLINAVNQGTKTFSTLSNVPDEFNFNNLNGSLVDARLTIDGSTGNDGIYTIVSASWTGVQTDIIVNEVIPNAVADGNILNKSIILSTTNKNFVPSGWMKLANEWLYYDGYDDADDDYYRIRNVVRGQLGTGAVAANATDIIYEKLAKQIAPGTVKLENDPGTGWVTMRSGREYQTLARLGCFVLPENGAGDYRVTYYLYDEDEVLHGGVAYVLTINKVITQLMTGASSAGGPGFAAGNLDFDTLDLRLNRYEYDPETKPQNVWDAIQDLIAAVSLEKELKFWYSHGDGKFKLAILSNAGPTITAPFVHDKEEDVGLDGVYSAVRASFTDDQELNRVNETYSWHQASTGVGIIPDYYLSVAKYGESYPNPFGVVIVAAGSAGMEFVADGKPGSKLGMIFDHNPAATVEFGHFWFGPGVTPPLIDLDKIILKGNTYRKIDGGQPYQNDQKTYVARLQGCSDYNSGTQVGTWEDLGCEIEGEPQDSGRWFVAEWDNFMKRKVNAVRVLWDYMAAPSDGILHYAFIHDLEIVGSTTKYVYVQTTDLTTDIGDVSKLYAPESHEKLRGGVASVGAAGSPRVMPYEIGAATPGAAYSLARTLLKTTLAQFKLKRYVYRGILPAKPELGITITVDEIPGGAKEYTGVLHGYNVLMNGDPQELVTYGTIMDHSADVID